MKLISRELPEIRAETRSRIDKVARYDHSKIAYLPSALRQYPVITSAKHGNQMISPLPQLIALRATSGLYYDLLDGHQSLLEEANGRFEAYGKKLIEARLPTLRGFARSRIRN